MNKRIIETEPLKRTVVVHGAMTYECDECKTKYLFWLEKGLEDRMQDEINPEKHKPVPYCITCSCGGTARHVDWHRDIRLDEYIRLEGQENYFENVESESWGVPHIRNGGAMDSLHILQRQFAALNWPSITEIEEYAEPFEEDDPYGLAHISTSKLKAELKRRKRW